MSVAAGTPTEFVYCNPLSFDSGSKPRARFPYNVTCLAAAMPLSLTFYIGVCVCSVISGVSCQHHLYCLKIIEASACLRSRRQQPKRLKLDRFSAHS
eukprot:3158639-Amphidinium_carterae.2